MNGPESYRVIWALMMTELVVHVYVLWRLFNGGIAVVCGLSAVVARGYRGLRHGREGGRS